MSILSKIKNAMDYKEQWLRVFLYGGMRCIGKDTHIPYTIRDASGRVQNMKGGSIERLYHRFNGLQMPGKGAYQRPQTRDSQFFVPCMDENRTVRLREIGGVYRAGPKECLVVRTEGGRRLVATAEHGFATPAGFVPLGDLAVGDEVMIHSGEAWSRGAAARVPLTRPQCYVKQHPHAPTKRIRNSSGEYLYHRLPRARAVVEAGMNGLSLDAYLARLNGGTLAGLVFLDPEDEVHHIDENPHNDTHSNLRVLSKVEHARLHAMERDHLVYLAQPERIVAIEPAGVVETYDVSMKDAPHNFVAAGFVVHNSGKTTSAASFPAPFFIGAPNENGIQSLRGTDIPYFIPGETDMLEVIGDMNALLNELHADMQRLNVAADGGAAWRAKWGTTIIWDSLSHYADAVVNNLTTVKDPRTGTHVRIDTNQQIWGKLRTHLTNARDVLFRLPCHIVLTALDDQTQDEKGNVTWHGPRIQGAAGELLPSSCELVGFCDALPPASFVVYFQKFGKAEAGTRLVGMTPGMLRVGKDPGTTLFDQLYPLLPQARKA